MAISKKEVNVLHKTKEELITTRLYKIKCINFISYSLFRKFFFKFNVKHKVINIFRKSSFILSIFNDRKFRIYNGRILKMVVMNTRLSGYNFGQLLFTRRFGKGELMHIRRKGKAKKR